MADALLGEEAAEEEVGEEAAETEVDDCHRELLSEARDTKRGEVRGEEAAEAELEEERVR